MNEIAFILQQNTILLITVCTIFGLMLGSFLNVVIFRYPVMMFREWESTANEVLTERGFKITPPDVPVDQLPEKFNLVVPRSACPSCGHNITALENVPIVSYLVLGGKCSNCKASISLRYPSIEALTGIAFGLCAFEFGFGIGLLIALITTAYLVAMSFIDIDHKYLPDIFTLPILWLGLLAGLFELYIPLTDAVIGAAAGYMILWSIYWLFKILTKKEGMGHGDFKLLAAIGAFVGWQQLGIVIILSAGVGAIIGGLMIAFKGQDSQAQIPFGPYLAAAGWITFVCGDQILKAYLNYAGLA